MNPADDEPGSRAGAVRAARERWRHEVADLGGRNTLLWHRDLPSGTFDLTVAHPGGVAKLLAGVTTLLSELVREQVAFAEARRRAAAIRAKTVELHREHGLTTGFIAVGMATWMLRRAPVPPRAPVLLRGCRIAPTDASHRDFAITLEPDVVFNPVLGHYLHGELGLDLDQGELASLSTRRAGFDPRPTYAALEEVCTGVPGFGIGPQMVISTYPWAKLPLVAELSDEAEQSSSELVTALAEGVSGGAGVLDPGEETVEEAVLDPAVLDADRSQRAVLRAVRAGQSLVVDAAPGTGRTQTVANVVADQVAAGRTVLLLSEHQPTLEATRRRLAGVGLDHLVLPLRETPQGAGRLVADLLASVARAAEPPTQDVGPVEGAEDPRAELPVAARRLAGHHDTLHAAHEPWGASLAQAQVALTELAARPHPPVSHVRLSGQPLAELVPENRARATKALGEAARIGAWERGRSEDPWYGAVLVDQAEAQRAESLVQRLVGNELQEAREAVRTVCAEAGLPEPLTLRQWGRYLELMGRARDTLDVFKPQIYEAPLDQLVAATGSRDGGERPSTVARGRLRRQLKGLLRPGAPPADLATCVRAAAEEKREWESLAGRAARPTTPTGWESAAEAFDRIESDLDWLASVLAPTTSGKDLRTTHLDQVLERLLRLEARTDRLPVTARSHALLQPLRDAGLGPLVDDIARRGVAPDDVSGEVDLIFWASLLDHLATGHEVRQRGQELRVDAETFADADRRQQQDNARRAVQTTDRRAAYAVRTFPEQVDVLRDAGQAPPPAEVKDLLGPVRDLATALRPCWAGSPLLVPTTVPRDLVFDLVVIEDAARVPLAHVVPGLERGRQLLAVGNRHDLPPRPFVTAVDERAEDRAEQEEQVGPAALGTLAAVVPTASLDVQYRPIDQRLVRTTAERFHPGTDAFPGVLRSPRVVHLGADGTEQVVVRVVDLVLDHARATAWQSLAVLAQDAVLAEDIDRVLRDRIAQAGLGRSFRDDAAEALLLSTVDHAGSEVRDRVIVALSPLRPVDARWAAAALGVARRSTVLVSDTAPGEWEPSPGLDLLRAALADAAAAQGSEAFDSPLVADLAARLRAQGLQVRGRYGTGRFAIELVVDDPDDTGRPLLAVHTDSLPAPAADRDEIRLRPEQLTARGWVPVEVLSSDLFRDPAREVARLLALAREASAARARR